MNYTARLSISIPYRIYVCPAHSDSVLKSNKFAFIFAVFIGFQKTGAVVFEDGVKRSDYKDNSRRGVSIDLIGNLAKATGVTFHFYKSEVNQQGKRVSQAVSKKLGTSDKNTPNDFYMNGEIWIDVNAGTNGEGLILFTASHELVHFIKDGSPADFNALAEFLMDKYGDKKKNVHNYIQAEMRRNHSLTPNEAYEEVIARMCESFLTDIHLSDKAAELYKQNRSLAEKIRDWLSDFRDRIATWYKGVSQNSQYASDGQAIAQKFNKAYDLYVQGIRNASENLRNAEQSTGDSGVLYSIREDAKDEIKQIISGKQYRSNVILTDSSPSIMLGHKGVKNLPLAMKPSHIRENILSEAEAQALGLKTGDSIHYHGLGEDLFYEVIDGLNDVTEAYRGTKNAADSERRENYFLLISKSKDANGESINVPVFINTKSQYNQVYIDTNTVATVFGRENIRNYINRQLSRKNLVRIKRKGNTASERTGLIPDDYSGNASTNNIHNTNSKINPSDEKTSFDLRDTVEETRDLIAVHNMTQDELLKSLQLGGLPMPSIAIFKAKDGHTEYGDVSLVFPKDTIDPRSDRRNKVYSIDSWTPTFPSIDYEVNEKKAENIYSRANKALKKPAAFKLNPASFHYVNLEDRINSYGGEQGFIEHYKDDYGMKQFYLAEQDKAVPERYVEKRTEITQAEKDEYSFIADALGKDVISDQVTINREWLAKNGEALDNARIGFVRSVLGTLSEDEEANLRNSFANEKGFKKVTFARRIRSYLENGGVTVDRALDDKGIKADIDSRVNQTEYEAWLKDFFNGIEQSKGINNGTDYYTSRGDKRSFAQTHYEVNLENVVKSMLQQENGGGFLGNLHLYGVADREYQSIDEIRADKYRLNRIDESEYSSIREGFGERYAEIVNSVKKKGSSGNELFDYDTTSGVIVEALRHCKTKSGIYNELKRYLPKTTEMVVDDLLSLVQDIATMPTGYFEAKPRRAVSFNEVATAIIPDTASTELKSALDEAGVKYAEYTEGDNESRTAALNAVEGVKFDSREDSVKYDDWAELISWDDTPSEGAIPITSPLLNAAIWKPRSGWWTMRLKTTFTVILSLSKDLSAEAF